MATPREALTEVKHQVMTTEIRRQNLSQHTTSDEIIPRHVELALDTIAGYFLSLGALDRSI